MSPPQPWDQIVSQKRSARDSLLAPYLVKDVENRVPRVERVEMRSQLDEEPEVQDITDIDSLAGLLLKIQLEEITAEQIARAYIKRYAH